MDPISDMIISIKNAGNSGLSVATFPYSKLKMALAEILKSEGFVKEVSKKGKKISKTIEVELLYNNDKSPKINGVNRVSKLSKRVYLGSKDIKPVKNKLGHSIVSTSKGVMTGKEAKKSNLGGEVLFEIW